METIEPIIVEYLESGFFTAAVCSISVNGETMYKKSFGVCDRTSRVPCKPDTRFDLASITKLFTSTAILRLITEKKLSLHSPLGECLPEVKGNPKLRSITIYQLLTHSSGLLAWWPLYTQREKSFYEILDAMELQHNSADKTVYSDLNYMLLGKVIERTLNRSLNKVVDEFFVHDLGFPSAAYNPISAENTAAAEFGNRIEKTMCRTRNLHFDGWRAEHTAMVGEVNDGNSFYFFNGVAGHAGIFSNADDLSKLGNLYLGNEAENFLSREVMEASGIPQVEDRGLGWDFGETFPEGFGHTGFTGTALWIVPDRNLVVVLLTNRLHSQEPRPINSFRRRVYKEILQQL